MLSTAPIGPDRDMLAKARAGAPVPTGVVAAHGAVVLESARLAADEGLIAPVLIGERARVERDAESIGWPLDGVSILEARDDAEAALLGARLAGAGELRALMKGALHTDVLLRGVLHKEAGLRTGRRLTHLFHLSFLDDPRRLIVTDAAVNVAPDAETLFQTAANAVAAAHALGWREPKVAFLSATEDPIDSMPSSVQARALAERCAGEIADALFAGPLALDNAISASAAEAKGIADPVAGHADILVVPNIETGNAIFKLLVYVRAACAAGVVMGAKCPVILTSRADPPAARLTSAALAALVAGR